ncbi:zinc finger domain-containing protein [Pseudonocardia sp.]|uniref:zinc finger domain-containing protein n=1 Tax=Pseudonocardia sp. TaxID=60912 RepID=UPI0031FDC682
MGTLKCAQRDALALAVTEALTAGLASGGATIDDFRHPGGVQGAFQDECLIHLRAREPCVRCGNTVVTMVAAGRGTYVCARRARARSRARRSPCARATPAAGGRCRRGRARSRTAPRPGGRAGGIAAFARYMRIDEPIVSVSQRA